MSFSEFIKQQFQKFSEALFAELKSGEDLNLNLNAENSLFVRFNGAKVRQNTDVNQINVNFEFQAQKRKIQFTTTLQGQLEDDISIGKSLIARARQEVSVLPEDPFLVGMVNNGTSENDYRSEELKCGVVLEKILSQAAEADFAGIFCAGPVIRANCNSKGQNHWFSTQSFYVDYSLYTVNAEGENKAVKSMVAGSEWSDEKFKNNFADSLRQLSLLRHKSRTMTPGKYKVYLAPGAVNALLGMFSWNALSFSSFKKGNCAMSKLYEGERTLSPHFSLRENFSLGLTPSFNNIGEVAPGQVSLIENGKLKSFLVSTRAAKEFGSVSNQAEFNNWGFEHLRSPEILSGTLAEAEALKNLGTGLYLNNLHYLNWSDVQNARITGMTRYACFWVENGEIVQPIKDMRFDESLFHCCGSGLEALTREQAIVPETETYGARQIGGSKVPGMLVNDFTFTL